MNTVRTSLSKNYCFPTTQYVVTTFASPRFGLCFFLAACRQKWPMMHWHASYNYPPGVGQPEAVEPLSVLLVVWPRT